MSGVTSENSAPTEASATHSSGPESGTHDQERPVVSAVAQLEGLVDGCHREDGSARLGGGAPHLERPVPVGVGLDHRAQTCPAQRGAEPGHVRPHRVEIDGDEAAGGGVHASPWSIGSAFSA